MITIISPAKTLDFESEPSTDKSSSPEHLKRSKELVEIMRTKSPKEISKLMGISPKLAELNTERFKAWKPPFNRKNAKQAVLAFRGDVYMGLDADSFTQRDFNFAQKNLRILSGLYGLLRPLDLIQPYRLEMGTRLANKRGKDLYQFWGDEITESLADELSDHRNKTLINLASNEYFKAVDPGRLPGNLITPVFKDYNNGTYKVLAFFAKKARGQMAAFIIRNRINKPQDIKEFNVDGYRYDESYSTNDQWVFTRKAS
ncbi:MAG: peroxide stress protein YaaA [Pseudomonadales bacterium]|nr:peroxide stress protein YaaA [Pseudomonadales bacterium]